MSGVWRRRNVMVLSIGMMVAGVCGWQVRAQTPAGVGALAWMAGSWAGQSNGLAMEEHWTAPMGGTMIGMHRDVKGDRTVSFEFLRIEIKDGKLQYIASPNGAPPTPFPLATIGRERVVFENAAHDFPQRILYWKENGALRARIEGQQGGKLVSEEWTWTRR